MPMLSDNYAYLIVDARTKQAAAVDPVEPGKLLEAVGALGLRLEISLTTHSHFDHAASRPPPGTAPRPPLTAVQGGNEELRRRMPGVAVLGGRGDGCPHITVRGLAPRTAPAPWAQGQQGEVGHGETVTLGGLNIAVIGTEGHTPGHVSYHVTTAEDPAGAVFTGDTMFVSGCGNFNTGTPAQMHTALVTRLARLPGGTAVYVGHE